MIAPVRRLSNTDKILIGVVAALSAASFAGALLEDRAVGRWQWDHPLSIAIIPRSDQPVWFRCRPERILLQATIAGLSAATLGLACVANRPGRGSRSRRRGPGHAALIVGGGMVLAMLASCANSLWIEPLTMDRTFDSILGNPPQPWALVTERVDPAVVRIILPAWIYLALTGHWRKPLDPMERPGRWIGWAWIALSAISWIAQLIAWRAWVSIGS